MMQKVLKGYFCRRCSIRTDETEMTICPRCFFHMEGIYKDVKVKEYA